MRHVFNNNTKRVTGFVYFFIVWSFTLQAQVNVSVDFSKPSYPPLVKTKFNVYQTPLASLDRLLRDNVKLKELEVRSLRFETAWGKSVDFNPPSITGSGTNPQYNRTDYTTYLQSVVSNDAEPLLTMGYSPNPLKTSGDEWRNMPNSMTSWKKINKDYAAYWKSLKIKPMTYEIWNEPDLFIFFLGTKQDYFQIYKNGSTGIREADPDAKIGGPVTAFDQWYPEFLSFVDLQKLPIDFLSGHAYKDYSGQLNAMRNALNSSKWNVLEMYLTEYASYPTTPPTDIRPNGKQERYVAAADFFKDAKSFLEYTDLTKVYWAQWSDVTLKDGQGNWYLEGSTDKMGLLDFTGNPKALFNAFKIYNQMPVDRNNVTLAGDGLDAMATSDEHNAGAVIWNTQESETKTTNLNLNNLPFASGTVEVYRIDADHSSYFENHTNADLTVVETLSFSGSAFSWTGEIPAKGLAYFRLFDASGISSLDNALVADLIRTHHWFTDRAGGWYADFDRKTWTTRLGMGKLKDVALAQVGAVMEKIPAQLQFNIDIDGTLLDKDINSALAVRIDYQDISGEYKHSVLFHGGLYHAERTELLPWGAKGQPSKTIALDDISEFTIDVKEEAPDNFRGRIILSYILQNTGKETQAKIKVRKASDEILPVQEIVTSLKKNETRIEVAIYPNPVGSTIIIECPRTEEVSFQVNDLAGKIIWQGDAQYINDRYEIQTEPLHRGMYILLIKTEGSIIERKVFVKE